MACARCGKKKLVEQSSKIVGTNLQEFYNSGDFVLAKYAGPQQIHNIGSPSGVIAQYDMTIYGRGKFGDIFLVHKDDIKHKNSNFIELNGTAITAAEKLLSLQPKTNAKTQEKKAVAEVEKTVLGVVKESLSEAETEVANAVKEVEEAARINTAEGEVLTRDTAIPASEFKEQYGFTHVLQVMAKVKSGELLSYKNEEDGKTYVYHVEN